MPSGPLPTAFPPPRDRRSLWPALADLIRLRNQTGTLLLLLPILWSLVIASHGRPPLTLVMVFTAGALLMRSAGVILNDLADRSFDRHVVRTQSRPLASGALGVPEAATACVVLLAAAGALLAALPPLAIMLSPVAVLLAAGYPFAKRVVSLPQAALGMAFGWGVVMAWAAVQEDLPLTVWVLYGATVCWAIGYDTVYAIQDREDDAQIGVGSAAVWLGDRAWIAVALALAGMLGLLAIVGSVTGVDGRFYVLLTAVAAFQTWEVRRIRRGLAGTTAFDWFKRQVWVGVAILAAFWLGLT